MSENKCNCQEPCIKCSCKKSEDELNSMFVANWQLLGLVLKAMLEKAKEMGVMGAASIEIIDSGRQSLGVFNAHTRLTREPKKGKGEDTGINYGAVVWTKMAQMKATLKDSGPQEVLPKGVLGYRGGICRQIDNCYLLIAFSGGTEDQDVEISEAGYELAREMDVPLLFYVTVMTEEEMTNMFGKE